jgi:signal transduction histidine kinase
VKTESVLYFAASVGNLFLANVVIFRARRARGALPITLLCLALFLWDMGEGFFAWTQDQNWRRLRLIGSSMAPAFLWHFVLLFTHRELSHRKWMFFLYAATAAFTISTAGSLLIDGFDRFVAGRMWNITYLVVLFPFLVWSFMLVRGRMREVDRPIERNALAFVAVGIAVGALTGFTDLTNLIWNRIPRLGYVGSVLCTTVLAIAILRHKLLEQQTPVRKFVMYFLLAASAVFVYVILFTALPETWQPTLVVGAVVIVTLLALYRMAFIPLYEQADRRKRLALIGTMAAGVAHEIKNPLAAIKGAAQFVQKELESDGPKTEAKDYLKLLVGEVDRLNGVIESFLSYARPLEPRRQDVALQPLLEEIVKFQSTSLPANVKVETFFDPEIPPLSADPDLLKHAVTNVFRNAAEAMTEGGTITVSTRIVMSAPRSFAAIEVADTGPGIKREVMERIFQPFFTTKVKGTGLGLAIALRIIEAHAGEIGVENTFPRGCRFTFHLPIRSL